MGPEPVGTGRPQLLTVPGGASGSAPTSRRSPPNPGNRGYPRVNPSSFAATRLSTIKTWPTRRPCVLQRSIDSVYTLDVYWSHERSKYVARLARAGTKARLRAKARIRQPLQPGQIPTVRTGVRHPLALGTGQQSVAWRGRTGGKAPDRKRYTITDTGRAEVEEWLAEPVDPEPYLQTVLFAKVVLALMLGRPAAVYLDAQRAVHLQHMRSATDLKRKGDVVDGLLADHALFHLDADLRWMDVTEARLSALAEVVSR